VSFCEFFVALSVGDIRAWSRLFNLFAVALLALASLGAAMLIPGDAIAHRQLSRLASRRRERCEASLMMATLSLIAPDQGLFDCLFPSVKLKLEAVLPAKCVLTSANCTKIASQTSFITKAKLPGPKYSHAD
jgi:hypothetical protein